MYCEALDDITDLDVLRPMVLQRDAVIAKRDHEIHFKTAKIDHLTQVIAKLQRREFAARSERFDPAQRALFDAALQADLAAAETQLQALTASSAQTPAQHERAQPKRRALPAELPRVEERIEPESCVCGTCGSDLHCIGEEVSGPLLRILRSRHSHIHVHHSSTSSPSSSSFAEPFAPSLPAVLARPSSRHRRCRPSSSVALPHRACWRMY